MHDIILIIAWTRTVNVEFVGILMQTTALKRNANAAVIFI